MARPLTQMALAMKVTHIEQNSWNKDRCTVTLREVEGADARVIRFDSPDDLVDGIAYGKVYQVTITEEEV